MKADYIVKVVISLQDNASMYEWHLLKKIGSSQRWIAKGLSETPDEAFNTAQDAYINHLYQRRNDKEMLNENDH